MSKGRGGGRSGEVTETSDALDLDRDIFQSHDPKRIAQSLKHSAEERKRRKASPFRSAMSTLVFYINRTGSNLPDEQQRRLEAAKDELRRFFDRPIHS